MSVAGANWVPGAGAIPFFTHAKLGFPGKAPVWDTGCRKVHYSNIERSLSNNLFQIRCLLLKELPRLPPKKSKVKKIQNLY